MRSVENEECEKCGVWKMRRVENAECGKCGEFNHNINNKKHSILLRFHHKIVHYFLKL